MGAIGSLAAGGTIDPDLNIPSEVTGILAANGAVTLNSATTLDIDLNGNVPGTMHDQLRVQDNNINLAGSNLNLRLVPGFVPAVNQQFTVVLQSGAGSLGGQFAQGTGPVTANGRSFTIAYTTGVVVLTALALQPEMDFRGNNISIVDGDSTPSIGDNTDFGSTATTVSHNFSILNSGAGTLNLTGSPRVVIGGTHAADFSVTVGPGSPLGPINGGTAFTVVFDPSAAGLRTATLSIANDDSNENPYNFSIQGTGVTPTLSINDVTQNEGNSGSANATFTITLSGASAQTVTMNYTTIDGTATVADNDYLTASGVLTFTPGQVTQTIIVLINGDTKLEFNESFLVNLSSPSGATIADAQGQGIITNDDSGSRHHH